MNRLLRKDDRFSRMVTASLLLHAALFGIICRLDYLQNLVTPKEQVYYVDVLNLPVAAPRSGDPSATTKSSVSTPAPPVQQEMKLPQTSKERAAKTANTPAANKVPEKVKNTETTEEFAERLAKLEKRAEERRQAAALEAIRKSAQNSSGRAGMPGARGTEAGSDYASYIQSRLRDAFNSTIAYQSRNPEVTIRLRLNSYGKIISYRMEKSSRDKLFENAVAQAINIAGENFPPPPDGKNFEQGFIFRPQGVRKK